MTAAALLAALTLGIHHSPAPPQDCAYIDPMLGRSPGLILSGNMRTTDGGCIVWLNLPTTRGYSRCWVAQLAAHEAGHLAGLGHSLDPNAVMFAPFRPLHLTWCRPSFKRTGARQPRGTASTHHLPIHQR